MDEADGLYRVYEPSMGRLRAADDSIPSPAQEQPGFHRQARTGSGVGRI